MVKIPIEVEIPEYNIKFCHETFQDIDCKYLSTFDYGCKYYCQLSRKEITKVSKYEDRIYRPYGCRCLAKKHTTNS